MRECFLRETTEVLKEGRTGKDGVLDEGGQVELGPRLGPLEIFREDAAPWGRETFVEVVEDYKVVAYRWEDRTERS